MHEPGQLTLDKAGLTVTHSHNHQVLVLTPPHPHVHGGPLSHLHDLAYSCSAS